MDGVGLNSVQDAGACLNAVPQPLPPGEKMASGALRHGGSHAGASRFQNLLASGSHVCHALVSPAQWGSGLRLFGMVRTPATASWNDALNKHALVIGSSGGIGHALAAKLDERGDVVTRLSRRHDGLDIASEQDVSEKLQRYDRQFDLIIVATGLLSGPSGPEKSLRALSADEMAMLFAVNAIGPALVLKHAKQLLRRDRRAVFAVLSARVGSIGDNHLGGWYSYRASKAALNQLLRTASIELRRTHKHLICTALHPGTVETEFTANHRGHAAVQPLQAAGNLIDVMDQLTPKDSGRFFDWAGKEVPW